MNRIVLIFILLSFNMFNCSSSEQTTKEETKQDDEIYVFDDPVVDSEENEPKLEEANSEVSVADTQNVETGTEEVIETAPMEQKVEKISYFVVQVGAFSTKEKAEKFIEENQSKIDQKMITHFSTEVNLHVVWLPKFSERIEAERIRNNLWDIKNFKDAFIVTVEEKQ